MVDIKEVTWMLEPSNPLSDKSGTRVHVVTDLASEKWFVSEFVWLFGDRCSTSPI